MSQPATRVAVIDCGTNSIRLLIADIAGSSHEDVYRDMKIVRLGQDVDRTGRFAPAALDRTFAAAREYAEVIERSDVDVVRFCATSAARDASNAEDLADGIRELLGVDIEILSGDDEARASFRGATSGMAGRAMVIDIGGGSTEIVVGDEGGLLLSRSFDVGSVRLTERFLASDPPTAKEVGACETYLIELFGPWLADVPEIPQLLGVAGTITTVAAHALGLASYNSSAIHGASLAIVDVQQACRDLVSMSVEQRQTLGFMHPGRADVIGAGAVILDVLLDLVPVRDSVITISEHDILDGIAVDSVN